MTGEFRNGDGELCAVDDPDVRSYTESVPSVAYPGDPVSIPKLALQPLTYRPKGKDAMSAERWARIKALRPHDTLMFKSCQPNKAKGTRATYRKAEHAK